MSLAVLATHMADKGRFGDDMLVHMSKDEVAALQQLAENHGMSLTINPETGLPEAFSLKKLLGAIAPIALNFLFPGAGAAIGATLAPAASAATQAALGGALFTGGISALASGSLEKGLMMGMMSYGMSGLGDSLAKAGRAASVPVGDAAAAAATVDPEVGRAALRAGQQAAQDAGMQAASNEAVASTGMYTPPTVSAQPAGFDVVSGAPLATDPAAYQMPNLSAPYDTATGLEKAKYMMQGVAKDPLAFAKGNMRNLMMVGLPAMSLMSEQSGIKGAGDLDPSKVMFPRKRYNPYTGTYEQLPGFTLADYRAGIAAGRNPMYAADGGIVALADGGVTKMAAGGVFTPEQYKAAGEFIQANINNPQVIADRATQLGLTTQDFVEAGKAVGVNLAPEQVGQYFGKAGVNYTSPDYSGLTATATPEQIKDVFRNTVMEGIGTEENFVRRFGAAGGDYANLMLARDLLTPDAQDYIRPGMGTQGIVDLFNRLNPLAGTTAGGINEANLVDYLSAKGYSIPSMAYAAERVGQFSPGSMDRYLTYTPGKYDEGFLVNQVTNAFNTLTSGGMSKDEFIDFARAHNFTDDILRKAGILDPLKRPPPPPGTTQPPISPVIPGTEGRTPTMGEIERTYTGGGGSLGYLPYAPKSVAEMEARYPLAGASRDAYRYLMGREGAKYPVSQRPEGGIMKPYWESVGMTAPKYQEKRLSPTGSSSLAGSGEATGSWRGLLAADKMALQNALADAQQSGDFSPLNALLQAYKLTLADLRQAFPGLSDADIKAYRDKLNFYIPPYVDPIVASGGGGPGSEGGPAPDAPADAPSVSVKNGGLMALAGGGASHLGDYSDGGRLLKGPGDGVSDSIPAVIANKRPARLADGEFVVPARIVSELGNGSTDAGARKLYAMMDRIQARRGKTTGKGKVAVNSRADKLLPA